MKTTKIIYWATTILIFIFDGVIPAFTSNTELAKQGVTHLGYPAYFSILLAVFKVPGALGLLLPMVKGRVKEWVYAGFAFSYLFAAASHWVIDGFGGMTIFPLVMLALLIVSYIMYHKLQDYKSAVPQTTASKQTAFTLQA